MTPADLAPLATADTPSIARFIEQYGTPTSQWAWAGAMSPAHPRVTGIVDFLDRFTGYGQVIGPDHREYRVHRKELTGIRELRTGQPVEFTSTEGPRGPQALAVRPCKPVGLVR